MNTINPQKTRFPHCFVCWASSHLSFPTTQPRYQHPVEPWCHLRRFSVTPWYHVKHVQPSKLVHGKIYKQNTHVWMELNSERISKLIIAVSKHSSGISYTDVSKCFFHFFRQKMLGCMHVLYIFHGLSHSSRLCLSLGGQNGRSRQRRSLHILKLKRIQSNICTTFCWILNVCLQLFKICTS